MAQAQRKHAVPGRLQCTCTGALENNVIFGQTRCMSSRRILQLPYKKAMSSTESKGSSPFLLSELTNPHQFTPHTTHINMHSLVVYPVCHVCADAVDLIAESGLSAASLVVCVALRNSFRQSGLNATAKAGFASLAEPNSDQRVATSHCWLEVLGQPIDLASSHLSIVEAAGQLGTNVNSPESLRDTFGEDGELLFRRGLCDPLYVLGHLVPVGVEHGLKVDSKPVTTKQPPDNVPGSRESIESQQAYQRLLDNDHLQQQFVREMPSHTLDLFTKISKLRVE